MSSYANVVARIEAARGGEKKSGRSSAQDTGGASVRHLRPVRSTGDEAPDGIASLLDNIRAHAKDGPTRTVVLAGVSGSEPVRAITTGLATHARQRGMKVVLGDLVPAPGPLRLVERSGNEALQIDDLAPEVDLIVIQTPPLTESVEGALFASACDGLVIVAERSVTERASLQAAAERARKAGCNTLGVVVTGDKDEMPTWLRRLLGGSSGQ